MLDTLLRQSLETFIVSFCGLHEGYTMHEQHCNEMAKCLCSKSIHNGGRGRWLELTAVICFKKVSTISRGHPAMLDLVALRQQGRG